jgi:hypothetical protein
MKPSVIVWDLETVPDLGGFAAANDLVGKSDVEDKLIRVRVAPRLVIPAFLRLSGDTDLVRAEVEAACATTVGALAPQT